MQGPQEKILDVIDEFMLSLINSIKEGNINNHLELRKHFSNNQKEFYIYTKYCLRTRLFLIFVRLNPSTQINKRKTNIYFLISISENYPLSPPVVTCLSDFIFPSLNDNRNIQTCLLPEWKANKSIVELIYKLPNFIYCIDNDYNNSILEIYGNYSINDKVYSVNDFLSSLNSKVKKIQILTESNDGEGTLVDRYLVINELFFIILNKTGDKFADKCKIVFYGELSSIEDICILPINPNESNYKGKAIIQVKWKMNMTKPYLNKIAIDKDKFSLIILEILNRKKKIESKFRLILNNDTDDIETLSKYIQIKEKYLENTKDQYTLLKVLRIYQRIIEIFARLNDDGFKFYKEKMTKLIEKYEKN